MMDSKRIKREKQEARAIRVLMEKDQLTYQQAVEKRASLYKIKPSEK